MSQPSGAYGKTCSVHFQNVITYLCTEEACDDRVLCQDCLKSHHIQHSHRIKLISDIVSEASLKQLDKDIKRINIILAGNNYNSLIEQLEKVGKEVQESVDKILNTIFGEIIKDIENSIVNADILASLKEEVLTYAEEISKYNPQNQDTCTDAMSKYAGKYTKLDTKVRQAEKSIPKKTFVDIDEVRNYLVEFERLSKGFRNKVLTHAYRDRVSALKRTINIDSFNYNAMNSEGPVTSIEVVADKN
jgi:hypothetical protein